MNTKYNLKKLKENKNLFLSCSIERNYLYNENKVLKPNYFVIGLKDNLKSNIYLFGSFKKCYDFIINSYDDKTKELKEEILKTLKEQ